MDALGKLGINLGLLIANIANLLLMIVLLRVLAYKPIADMLQRRRERIAEGLRNARAAEEALVSAETDKKRLLDEAQAEAQRILREARARADEEAVQIKAKAQAEAQYVVEEARRGAVGERDRVMADMRSQIVSLSTAAASRLLGANLDEDRQRQLVEDFFTHIPPDAKKLTGSLTVITAVPLRADEQSRFEKEFGTEDVTFKVDPAILGGVIVRADGQQVDDSYVKQLAALRSSLS
ncbi:MAG: F0F1 ATP synthase subunit B [Anaerolineae bacterium]|nr:F0F1 ATP synthase subunit B [Anaerolineae bacterium]